MSNANGFSLVKQSWLAIALLFGLVSTATAKDSYELLAHEDEVFGKYALLEGRVDVSIERFEKRLADARSLSRRTPLLINLCAAYTLNGDFAKAKDRCDAAVENGWSAKMAYNNRGILNVARGDYLAAIEDFERAAGQREAGLYGRHLLQARNRVESFEDDSRLAEVSSDDVVMVALAVR